MRKLLKLQHHKHSGKKLHHRHTSFRGLTIVLAASIVAFVGMSKSASALDYDVTAKVSAPIPSQPAQISNPVNNTVFASNSITISGTCQVIAPATFVLIERSKQVVGSTGCNPSGTFSLHVALIEGLNSFVPRSKNITNDYGPDGSAVSVSFIIPKDPDQPDNLITTKTDLGTLYLKSLQDGLVFSINNKVKLNLEYGGGAPPYELLINWGDGDKDNIVNQPAGSSVLNHQYLKNEIYQIEVKLIDKNGKIAILNIGALSAFQDAPLLINAFGSTGPGNTNSSMSTFAIIGFGVTGVSLIGLWLLSSTPLKMQRLFSEWRQRHLH